MNIELSVCSYLKAWVLANLNITYIGADFRFGEITEMRSFHDVKSNS